MSAYVTRMHSYKFVRRLYKVASLVLSVHSQLVTFQNTRIDKYHSTIWYRKWQGSNVPWKSLKVLESQNKNSKPWKSLKIAVSAGTSLFTLSSYTIYSSSCVCIQPRKCKLINDWNYPARLVYSFLSGSFLPDRVNLSVYVAFFIMWQIQMESCRCWCCMLSWAHVIVFSYYVIFYMIV